MRPVSSQSQQIAAVNIVQNLLHVHAYLTVPNVINIGIKAVDVIVVVMPGELRTVGQISKDDEVGLLASGIAYPMLTSRFFEKAGHLLRRSCGDR